MTSATCTAVCLEGSYSTSGSSECTDCLEGTYASSTGLSRCTSCPKGYYGDDTALSTSTCSGLCAIGKIIDFIDI